MQKYDFLNTSHNTYNLNYKMDANSLITYLNNVLDDALLVKDTGYLKNFLIYEDGIVKKVQKMSGRKYYQADSLLEKINNEVNNNISDLEDIADS